MRYGADVPLGEVAGDQVLGGLEFGFSNQSSDVGIGSSSANISTNAYDATLDALWVANSQLYVEGRLRYGYFDSSVSLNGGDAVDFNGSGYGISIEIGKPFTLSDKLTLIPADVCFGRGHSILKQREGIKRKTIEIRRLLHSKSAA